ncbi:hypothetical protein [Photobacterium lutimaris]|uniref:Uncharacterized protein n=1 Tax=Photobacterium lutimaris TaxID=388278 RepID=A0A2T3ITJ7_9GAMM|nr:hypothetical protein [Photobacterium lutimaris]PSU31689.1 hypothetical protein C9I99_21110 [Photobacterium lutimaris]TDR72674.1 hypothetical protein DFP78_113150 [Photobacterium lutimaris]
MAKSSIKDKNTIEQLIRADFRLISQILCGTDPAIALEEYGVKFSDLDKMSKPYASEAIHESLIAIHKNNLERKSIFADPNLFESFFDEFRFRFIRFENVLKALALKASSEMILQHEPKVANSIKTISRLRHEYLDYFDGYYRQHCRKRIEKYPDYREKLMKRLGSNAAQRKAYKPSYAEILQMKSAYREAVELEMSGSSLLLHVAETALVDINQIKFAVPEIGK